MGQSRTTPGIVRAALVRQRVRPAQPARQTVVFPPPPADMLS